MAAKNLRIELEELTLFDVGAKTGEQGPNVLNFVVKHPRPDVGSLSTTIATTLRNGEPLILPPDERILFNASFEGTSWLVIEVTAVHEVAKADKFLLGVLGAAIGVMTNPLKWIVLNQALEKGREALLGAITAEDRLLLIGEVRHPIDPENAAPELELPLEVEQDVVAHVFLRDEHNRDSGHHEDRLVVSQGRNGYVRLLISEI